MAENQLIQAFNGEGGGGGLVTSKKEEDTFKNESARVVTTDSHCKFIQIFFESQGQLTPQSEVGSI